MRDKLVIEVKKRVRDKVMRFSFIGKKRCFVFTISSFSRFERIAEVKDVLKPDLSESLLFWFTPFATNLSMLS